MSEQTDEDIYAAAWDEDDQAQEPGEQLDTPPEPGPEPDPAPEPDPEPQPEAQPEPAPAPEPPRADQEATWEQRYKSFEGRYRVEKERMQRELEELRALRAQPPQAQQPPAPDEEAEFLDQFAKEYSPDVLKAIDIAAARKAREMLGQVAPSLQQLERGYQDMEQRAHFAAIAAAHPDFQQVAADPAFQAWVEAQPRAVAETYRHVLTKGHAIDVIDTLTAYKAQARPQPAAAPQAPRIDAAKAQAATAVRAKRGSMPQSKAAKDDYDGAWDEAPDD